LAARGLAAERLTTGETLQLDDATLRVLWPDDGRTRPAYLDPAATDNRKTNDASVVLLGEFEGRRFLLTGDVEDDVDPVLLSRGLPALDMLKVAHHGSATASSDVLLSTVRPRVSVVSVGAHNTYGHPNAATMARLRAHSSRVLRTDQNGTVEVTLNSAEVTVAASRTDPSSGADVGVNPAADAAAGATAGTAAGSLLLPDALLPDVAVPGSSLLYDSPDVYSEPSRKRGIVVISRTAAVASPPLARRRRDRGLAGGARRRDRQIARPPPGGERGPSS
jgi:hypothetical protein